MILDFIANILIFNKSFITSRHNVSVGLLFKRNYSFLLLHALGESVLWVYWCFGFVIATLYFLCNQSYFHSETLFLTRPVDVSLWPNQVNICVFLCDCIFCFSIIWLHITNKYQCFHCQWLILNKNYFAASLVVSGPQNWVPPDCLKSMWMVLLALIILLCLQ